jgi:hypothetical protein
MIAEQKSKLLRWRKFRRTTESPITIVEALLESLYRTLEYIER